MGGLNLKAGSGWTNFDGNADNLTVGVNHVDTTYDFEAETPIPQCSTSCGVPTGATATAGDSQAIVSWDAPATNSGAVLTGYLVTASPGGATCTTTGALTCTVTGLTNGTAYTFTVQATNDTGAGAPSVASAPVTPFRVASEAPAPAGTPDFTPVTPQRVFDTRPGWSLDALRPVTKAKIGGAIELEVKMTDLPGFVPATGVGAVSLTVTATDPAFAGFVTAYPCGTRDFVSTVNYLAGQTVANAAIVPVSADGTVCFYSFAPTDVIVDINGWFAAGQGFTAIAPKRVCSTPVRATAPTCCRPCRRRRSPPAHP